MRADRLLALLMLLQTRGRMTAQKLAEALEVSERTIYRDIEALSTAGVPVYAERGVGGGCALVESYRTNLTGLKENEVRALFMLNVPAALEQLGVSQELRGALLKLSAALPESRRQEEARVRQRILLDSTPWSSYSAAPVPQLQIIQQAMWEERTLRLVYRPWFGTQVDRVVEPYGLVAKANVWHLVARRQGTWRVYNTTRVLEAHLCSEHFERCQEFDLGEYWQAVCAAEASRPRFQTCLRVSPELMHNLADHFGPGAVTGAQVGAPDEAGRVTIEVVFESLFSARSAILGLGQAVEVMEPEMLRLSVADFAQQIVRMYASIPSGS